jgi:hypothetical protein
MSTRKDNVAAGRKLTVAASQMTVRPLVLRGAHVHPQMLPNPTRRMTETPIPGLQATARPTRFRSYHPQLVNYRAVPAGLQWRLCGCGRSHGGVTVICRVVWVPINTDTQ